MFSVFFSAAFRTPLLIVILPTVDREPSVGTRTIAEGWKYVDIAWLVKIKTDRRATYTEVVPPTQPHGKRTQRTVLTRHTPLLIAAEVRRPAGRLRNTESSVLRTCRCPFSQEQEN